MSCFVDMCGRNTYILPISDAVSLGKRETTMDKRTETAMKVLAGGGYFRRQLESTYTGSKFKFRLKDADGRTVRGIGFATFTKVEASLRLRECAPSSSWPMEWELRA